MTLIIGTAIALKISKTYGCVQESEMNWVDNVLGGHSTALQMRSDRAEILAGNVANSDTPGFKARDIDFKAEFQKRLSGTDSGLTLTNSKHFGMNDRIDSQLLYRIPENFKSNGNTVEAEAEQAAFTKNAVQYQASVQFLSSKMRGIRLALKGE